MRALLLTLSFLVASADAMAEINFGVGTAASDCAALGREITRDWLMLKDFMAPDLEDKKRPKYRDFQCVDPVYMRALVQRPSRGGRKLKCYSDIEADSIGFCCDANLTNCAMYNPRQN